MSSRGSYIRATARITRLEKRHQNAIVLQGMSSPTCFKNPRKGTSNVIF